MDILTSPFLIGTGILALIWLASGTLATLDDAGEDGPAIHIIGTAGGTLFVAALVFWAGSLAVDSLDVQRPRGAVLMLAVAIVALLPGSPS